MPENPDIQHYAVHSFGAQFAEVRLHEDTGEVRVREVPITAGRFFE
jgi:xanthine dehydrogenase YagR molybdenum-binding subunit